MRDLKIKVNSEAESKEVQGLFFSLGYGFEGNEIKEIQDFEYVGEFYFFAYGDDCDLTHSCDSVLFTNKPHKEITLPELRDMVKPMKEYLIPSRNYEYILTDAREALEPHAKDWIAIPEGAEISIKFKCDPDEFGVVFYKNSGKSSFSQKNKSWENGSNWKMEDLLDENHSEYGVDLSHDILWQRPTQPEPLPFIDDNPQSLSDQYAEIEKVRQAVKVKSGSDSDHALDAMSYGFIGVGAAQAVGGVDATLAERQSTYGNFEDVAFVTENIMAVLSKARTNGLSDLPHTHRMALYMIASKMARIVNGDFNHFDSWHDIGGYSKLIEKLINGEK